MEEVDVLELESGITKPAINPKATKHSVGSGPSLKDRLNKLLENVSNPEEDSTYHSCILPSGKEIFIRPAYFEDERQALQISRSQKIPYIEALARLTVKDVNYNELPYFDHLYILLKLREFTFGNEYPVQFNCAYCNEENHLTVKVNELHVNRANPPLESLEVSVKLPIAQKTVYARIPRITESSEATMDKIANFILRVEDEDDSHVIRAFLNKLPLKDISTLFKAIINDKFGVDPEIGFQCIKCKELNTYILPLSIDFFTSP